MPNQPAPESGNEADDFHKPSDVEKADVALGAKLAKHRDHPVAKAAGEASKIGDQGPLYAISTGVLIMGLASHDRRLARSGFAMLVAVGAADVGKRLAKALVRRTRPHVLLDEHRYESDAGGSARKPEQSFPSGHTACSVAAARALSRDYPQAGVVTGIAAAAIGVSRVAKGAHWPLDVVGGAVVGLLAEAVSHRVIRLAIARRE